MKNLFRKFQLYYYTLKYLKPEQLYYRIYYRFFTYKTSPETLVVPSHYQLKSDDFIPSYKSFDNYRFTFLNQTAEFSENAIDWDYSKYGKLWTYNLNYFDFLNQKENASDPYPEKETALKLIDHFIQSKSRLKNAHEPYPISLRSMNWIKFLIRNQISDERINRVLYEDLCRLCARPEYHLLGNHLLENAFALFTGGCYFHEKKFYDAAIKIFSKELIEQILPDGAHFELSPMYHQIMLLRLLDCCNLVKNNPHVHQDAGKMMFDYASKMRSWLTQVSFSGGDIPLVNDAANRIVATTSQLIAYADKLGIADAKLPLKESGYRKIIKGNFEIFIDAGNIGPDYIPGHAHSDTFNFLLNVSGKPVIVDTGISTYEANKQRLEERSTSSHNTVQLDRIEQSEVWSSFRVGRRAHVIHLVENENMLEATHDGYKHLSVLHSRKFLFDDYRIAITDTLKGKSSFTACAFLHFHPDIQPVIDGNVVTAATIRIECKNHQTIRIADYFFASEFNKRIPAKKLIIEFKSNLETNIYTK